MELDAAKATWLSHDIVMFSSKNGEILLLTVVYDGRYDTIATICTSVLDFILIVVYFSGFTELCKD